VVALYSAEIGRVGDEVRGVGDPPFGIAAGTRPGASNGARLFATAFGRGNVSIIDVPDLDNLASAAVLLNIGPNQNCLNDSASARPPASECPQ
jgi:hypothetical protein